MSEKRLKIILITLMIIATVLFIWSVWSESISRPSHLHISFFWGIIMISTDIIIIKKNRHKY